MQFTIQRSLTHTAAIPRRLLAAALIGVVTWLLPAGRGEANDKKAPAPVLSDEQRQKAAEFYKDKTLSWITFTDAGSTTDTMLRVIFKYLPKYIPGNPRMGPITYQRGGGGTIAANYIVERAPKDGTFIGQLNFMQQRQFEGHKGVRFDVRKINWIGNFLPQNDRVLRTRGGAGFDTLEELLKAPRVNMGTFEVGHSHWVQLRLGQHFLNAPFHIIPGYTTDEMDLAIDRGELDGRVEAGMTFLSKYEKQYREGKERVHWSSEPSRFELMPEVPTLFEVIEKYSTPLNELETRVMNLIPTLTRYARYIGMPPGVPTERVLAVREGFYRTLHDPQFRQEFEKVSGWPPHYTGGDVMLKEFTELVEAPKQVVEFFQMLAGPKPLPKRK